jgi:peptidoglycan hydrolase CwlO-like protein
MSKYKVLSVLGAALLLASQPCWAANSKTATSAQDGNPFDELRALISENRNLIEANQGAIAALETKTDAINARVDSVEANLAAVAAQVATNTADITTAFQRIATAQGDIESLRNDLGTLAGQHQADIAAMQTTLASIQGQINDLVSQSMALSSELNDRVAELRGLINNNAVGIDALVLDISMLNAQVGSINSSILALSNQQDNLTSQVTDQSQQLTNLNAALAALKARVDSYHGTPADPCFESIALGQAVNGELVNNGECISDSRNYGGTHGAHYYTFTIASPATVTIDMDGRSCPGTGTLSDPYIYLHLGGPDGAVIAQNDDSSRSCNGGWGSLNSRITQTLQPGTYTVEATSYNYTQYGTFQLSVQ